MRTGDTEKVARGGQAGGHIRTTNSHSQDKRATGQRTHSKTHNKGHTSVSTRGRGLDEAAEGEVPLARERKGGEALRVEDLGGLGLALLVDQVQTLRDVQREVHEQRVRGALDVKVAEEHVGLEEVERLVDDVGLLCRQCEAAGGGSEAARGSAPGGHGGAGPFTCVLSGSSAILPMMRTFSLLNVEWYAYRAVSNRARQEAGRGDVRASFAGRV